MEQDGQNVRTIVRKILLKKQKMNFSQVFQKFRCHKQFTKCRCVYMVPDRGCVKTSLQQDRFENDS